ncbi:acetyl esterase [Edwardsiella piscicida]|nr:acetyl esterase [Edwardsiella piscicida]ELM3730020.1 acetyl esterase [Edwardsiella piscicida]ELV7534880.1 acetyl esterase [Edwardsiella piscicida]
MQQKNKVNVPERISDEMKRVLQFQQQNTTDEQNCSDYSSMRQAYIQERQYWNQGGAEMARCEQVNVETPHGPVATRIYFPRHPAQAVLFYLHGGGFIVGNLDTHDRIMRLLADYSRCAVIGIDYSLSPEARFPQAIEESVAVCEFFHRRADEFGLPMARIGFVGDSAGAMLAMATVLWMRDRGIDCGEVRGVLLYYGLYGLQDSASRRLYGGVWDGLTQADLQSYEQAYLPDAASRESPYYCLFNNDLTYGIPPCFIAGAQFDPLLDDSVALYQTLREHRQPCSYHMYPGVMHAFLHYSRMMESADRALRDGADYFYRQLQIA